ncbi:glutathione S-transferase family protein [Tropicimonas aquimaris]|uniref:Glutathione S-transferase family protein n=1 Tax=Tropicimonas aquimaris TaxID=914152 RepID=A0ABW3IRF9_9RHOB
MNIQTLAIAPDLANFPITRRWPARHPDRIQLYSWPTPNGVKVSIALEEMGLSYEAHQVRLRPEDVKSPEFRSLNPNGKIPAIIDPNGPDGAPIGLFESGAILLYLAEKTGQLAGGSARDRQIVTQWLMFQMGGVGPMFGQLGYFHSFAGSEIGDPRPRQRYIDEAKRLLGVLDEALEGKEWIAGEYSIADIAIVPWLRALGTTYNALELVGMEDFPNVSAWRDRFLARPAVQRGLNTPPRD